MVAAHKIASTVVPLTPETAAAVSAQLGVYELLAEDGATLMIGAADARQPFGMRSALAEHVGGEATHFRYEFTHGYRSRWIELLMLHQAEHGELPAANAGDAHRIGRLS